jgi:hypothetical protein
MDKSLLEYYSRDGEPDSPDPLATSGGYDALIARVRRQNAINAENAARWFPPDEKGLLDVARPRSRNTERTTREQENLISYLYRPKSSSPYMTTNIMNAWDSMIDSAAGQADAAATGIGAIPPTLYRDIRFAAPDRRTPAYEPGQPYDEEETGNVLFRRGNR